MSKPKPITEVIRDAIKNSGLTPYRIAKDSGVSQPTLSRFLSRQRGLSADAVDRLAEALGLRLVKDKPRKTSSRRK
jgi:transcriptional regulator with XRE-family HTH domain